MQGNIQKLKEQLGRCIGATADDISVNKKLQIGEQKRKTKTSCCGIAYT